jgi:hypothetical protein
MNRICGETVGSGRESGKEDVYGAKPTRNCEGGKNTE